MSEPRVLNVSGSGEGRTREMAVEGRRPPGRLAVELQKTMLRLKGRCMSEDGRQVNYEKLRSSPLFEEYQSVARGLCECDLTEEEEEEEEEDRKAFFINVYNALTVHGLATTDPLPSTVLELDRFWSLTAYNIGGHIFSLDDIEHGILRGNKPHPAADSPPFSEDDPRRTLSLKSCDPRIHFALVCGARSCPAIQVYSPSNLDRALNSAAQSFCSQEVAVDEMKRRVTTSKIFHWYASDFGSTERELLQWVSKYVAEETREQLERLLVSDDHISITARDYNWQLNSVL